MLTVYGYSDDLVEIDGDIRDEFTYPYDDKEGCVLAFSNGLILRIKYNDNGIWRITPVFPIKNESFSISQAPENDDSNYSDIATINDDIDWVVMGQSIGKKKR